MSEAPKKKFVLVQSDKPRTIVWPVDVNVPVDGGTFEVQQLRCRFEILPSDEIERLESLKSLTEFEEAKSPDNPGYGSPLILRVLKGFEDLREEEKGPVVPDAEAIPLMLKQPNVYGAIHSGYYAMVQGRTRKN